MYRLITLKDYFFAPDGRQYRAICMKEKNFVRVNFDIGLYMHATENDNSETATSINKDNVVVNFYSKEKPNESEYIYFMDK